MEIVFSHVWAIWWWRLTHVNATADSLRTGRCALGKAPSTSEEIKAMGVRRIRQAQVERGAPSDLPVELLSKDNKPRARLNLVKVRSWNGHVPMGAICVAGEQLVCSPEFTFVLVACDIGRICKERLERWQHVVVLVELACELCGTYSKQNNQRGFKNRRVQLVTTHQMRNFACDVAHERGASLAYEALRWAIDGLNSPMETAVYLMLCLPCRWGGLALPRPRANWSLPVPMELWNKTKKRHVMPDLYWPEWGLAVEFFGEEFHEGREREDRERLEIEQDMGLKVVTFWKDDVTDLGRFNAKAESVARYLGRQLPAASAEFAALQSVLQKMLVKHPRWL